MKEFRQMHMHRTSLAFSHLIECHPSVSDQLSRCLALYLLQFLDPTAQLSEQFKNAFESFKECCICEDCAVAVIQVSRVIFDRHSQVEIMRSAKNILSLNYINQTDLSRKVPNDEVLFRSCLLASNQHKELFWSYVRYYALSTKANKICVEFSMENDWNYWNNGVPSHRAEEVRETIKRLIPELTSSSEQIINNHTKLEIRFTGRSRPRWQEKFDLVFRLEDEHPLIDIALDSKLVYVSMPVITITCRMRTKSGRDSHLCLTRKNHGDIDQFLMIPPVDPFVSISKSANRREKVTFSHRNLKLVSVYGQRRINDFWSKLNQIDSKSMIQILNKTSIEKWAFVGSNDNADLLEILKNKVPEELAHKVEFHDRKPIERIVEEFDLFVALPIEGAGSTARQVAALGMPIWLISDQYDIASIFPNTVDIQSELFEFRGLSNLLQLLDFPNRMEFLRKLQYSQKNQVSDAINIKLLARDFEKIKTIVKSKFEALDLS